MECSCEVEVDADCCDPIECHSEIIRTARKAHVCNECCRQIEPGEKYEFVKFIQDGSWDQHKTCADCLSLRKQFMPRSWVYENLHEYVREHIRDVDGDVPESCIAALTPGARAWVCAELEYRWEDMEMEAKEQ